MKGGYIFGVEQLRGGVLLQVTLTFPTGRNGKDILSRWFKRAEKSTSFFIQTNALEQKTHLYHFHCKAAFRLSGPNDNTFENIQFLAMLSVIFSSEFSEVDGLSP